MESVSIRKDGMILAWVRRGWLSSSGKTNWPSYLNFFMFIEYLIVCCPLKPSMIWCNFRFHYMVLADDGQRIMPMPKDQMPPQGQPLAYPEAVLLMDPINPDLRGEIKSS